MDVEDQKFMALEGLQTWARGILMQVREIESTRSNIVSKEATTRIDAMRRFQRARHFLLIAAYKLIEYVDWLTHLNMVDETIFKEINSFRDDIKNLRDMNEHAIEYFRGAGRRRKDWIFIDEESSADASSTVGSKIGGRLDWNELAAAANRLISAMPAHYYPVGK